MIRRSRGIQKADPHKSYWVYGAAAYVNTQPNDAFILSEYDLLCSAVIPESVGEDTGFTSRDGKPIYENDFLEVTYHATKNQQTTLALVSWSDPAGQWIVSYRNSSEPDPLSEVAHFSKIIGNTMDKNKRFQDFSKIDLRAILNSN